MVENLFVVLSVTGSFPHSLTVDPSGYFLFQPVSHDWINKGCGMCCALCWLDRANKVAYVVVETGFLFLYLNGPLLYGLCHIIILN